ncbi:hypothetical protein LQ327_32865 [Actinomycetospora endophytica]|uniref:Uncharacterized protein n=1 Tax=Actinomycetospora endophytica TaxID=2291215 RepID=A0ABS8PIS2_9PSEU|nr:hypothetical protein [Actinomycetospora endophytica]MCD2198173.1 hypothetical protein [Actinomycetospora endophytica]
MSTTRPSPTTARSHTTSSSPPRRAIPVMAVGLTLTLVALAVPVVDQLTVGSLAAHLRAAYAGTGVAPPAASAITAYLVGLGLLGLLPCLPGLVAVVVLARRTQPPTGVV